VQSERVTPRSSTEILASSRSGTALRTAASTSSTSAQPANLPAGESSLARCAAVSASS